MIVIKKNAHKISETFLALAAHFSNDMHSQNIM
jgi:hypothetical protein